jgi:hypothetical protein
VFWHDGELHNLVAVFGDFPKSPSLEILFASNVWTYRPVLLSIGNGTKERNTDTTA